MLTRNAALAGGLFKFWNFPMLILCWTVRSMPTEVGHIQPDMAGDSPAERGEGKNRD